MDISVLTCFFFYLIFVLKILIDSFLLICFIVYFVFSFVVLLFVLFLSHFVVLSSERGGQATARGGGGEGKQKQTAICLQV